MGKEMGKAPSPALFAFCFAFLLFLVVIPAGDLLLLCFCFAFALLLLCFCFAFALLLLCFCFAFALLLPSPFLLLPVAFVVARFCRHPEPSEGSRGPQTFQRSQPLSHHNLIVAVYQPRQKRHFRSQFLTPLVIDEEKTSAKNNERPRFCS
jgi:hypothetical protein